MALDKATLIASLTTIFGTEGGNTPAQAASDIADAIDIYVRTATVNTTVAIVSVSGVTTGPGVSGPGAGTGTGTIS